MEYVFPWTIKGNFLQFDPIAEDRAARKFAISTKSQRRVLVGKDQQDDDRNRREQRDLFSGRLHGITRSLYYKPAYACSRPTRHARAPPRRRPIARPRASVRRRRAGIRLESLGHALRAALLRQIRRILIYK